MSYYYTFPYPWLYTRSPTPTPTTRGPNPTYPWPQPHLPVAATLPGDVVDKGGPVGGGIRVTRTLVTRTLTLT